MARRRAILSSIAGVGARISALVVVEMPELGAIDRKAAASLAGLAPHPSQSGLSRGRNAISGGRPCVRAAFYTAALVATRSIRNSSKPSRPARRRKTGQGRPRRHRAAPRHPRQRPHPRRHSLQQRTLRLTNSIQSPAGLAVTMIPAFAGMTGRSFKSRVQACIRAPLVILSTSFLSSRSARPTTFMASGAYCLTVARLAASWPVVNMSSI